MDQKRLVEIKERCRYSNGTFSGLSEEEAEELFDAIERLHQSHDALDVQLTKANLQNQAMWNVVEAASDLIGKNIARPEVYLEGDKGKYKLAVALQALPDKQNCTCPEKKLHGGESAVCPWCLEKRKEETEPRHCVKCGARVEKGDAAHPYTCIGKGSAANPAPFHDCVGVRFCSICNTRL